MMYVGRLYKESELPLCSLAAKKRGRFTVSETP